MPYYPEKYTRITVDMTHEEYNRLHRMTEIACATKSMFVRRAVEEKLEREEQLRKQQQRGR